MQPYRTKDMGCGAYLMSHGCRLIGADKAPDGHTLFEFQPGDEAAELAADFLEDCDAPASTLLRHYQRLRTVVRQGWQP